jgi:urease accessory protein
MNMNRTSPAPPSHLTDLRLLHLADSALPIGALAHSFGLESLVAEGLLAPSDLENFFQGWLAEAGMVEAVFCREAVRLASADPEAIAKERWLECNSQLSARKTARESRSGSVTLGGNFLVTVLAVHKLPSLVRLLAETRQASDRRRPPAHYCLAFGLVAGILGFDEHRTALTFLHQSIACMVSGCQRLLPLGQNEAARILWNIKPLIVEATDRSAAYGCHDVFSCMPLLDWGAMEHPSLSTRLFVS